MKSKLPLALLCCLLAGFATAQEATKVDEPRIDFNQARALFQKERAGEFLTEDEHTYLERAKALRNKQQPAQRGDSQRVAPSRLIPLTDMTALDRYEGEDGGLYGGGHNNPPIALAKAATAEIGKIQALDESGKPSADGCIVFISISMSNATQEFSRFKELADRSPAKSKQVTIVDCAQGGQAMAEWVSPGARPWQVALERLATAKVTPQQVQVAWVKLANKSPVGSLGDHGRKLEADTLKVLHNAKQKFPNLRIVYLGSRIWAGNASGRLNPEPYAYESAFAARWLICRQMDGDTELATTETPLLLWGPYLWAEGIRGRQGDSLIWEPKDFAGDGVHPSNSGRRKVAELLLDFVSNNPLAKPWFSTP